MSNVKSVYAIGLMPFNTWENNEMLLMLGNLNQPSGLRIRWSDGPIEYKTNEHNGKTAHYGFHIEGVEGYRIEFFEKIITIFTDFGATFQHFQYTDIDNNFTVDMLKHMREKIK